MAPNAVLAEDSGLALAIESDGLVCREALSGRLVWRVPLASATNSNFDPAVDESSVYLGLGDGKVYALDLGTGAVRWEQKVGNPLPEEWRHEAARFTEGEPPRMLSEETRPDLDPATRDAVLRETARSVAEVVRASPLLSD